MASLHDTILTLIDVFEAGPMNSAQRQALHKTRVALGVAKGLGCPHESTAYEEGDRLICQVCREDITP